MTAQGFLLCNKNGAIRFEILMSIDTQRGVWSDPLISYLIDTSFIKGMALLCTKQRSSSEIHLLPFLYDKFPPSVLFPNFKWLAIAREFFLHKLMSLFPGAF